MVTNTAQANEGILGITRLHLLFKRWQFPPAHTHNS